MSTPVTNSKTYQRGFHPRYPDFIAWLDDYSIPIKLTPESYEDLWIQFLSDEDRPRNSPNPAFIELKPNA